MITIHPKSLANYPEDVWIWISRTLLNNIRIWCRRRDFGYYCLWVRENYVGDRREHLHLLLHVPETRRQSLEAALRRWLPGDDAVVKLDSLKHKPSRFGQLRDQGLTYLLKQMTPQAWWSLQKRVRRDRVTRDGEVG